MYQKANVDSYATALCELLIEDNYLNEGYNFFLNLSKQMENDNTFIDFFANQSLSKFQKFDQIDSIFNDLVKSQTIINFFKVIIEKNAFRLFKRIIKNFIKIAENKLKIKRAKIFSAFELSEIQIEKFKKYLSKKYNSDIVIETHIDKSLISGFKIKLENEIIEQNYALDLKKMGQIIVQKGEIDE